MDIHFQRGTRPRAADLNRLAESAGSAHLGSAGFLAVDNGSEQVPRNPRRTAGLPPVRLAPADVCLAVVRGDTGVPGVYEARLYPNGMGGPGRSSATVSMTEFGPENDIPAGTVVLAHAIAIAAAEDGEDD